MNINQKFENYIREMGKGGREIIKLNLHQL